MIGYVTLGTNDLAVLLAEARDGLPPNEPNDR
jgi:hypothetical protein